MSQNVGERLDLLKLESANKDKSNTQTTYWAFSPFGLLDQLVLLDTSVVIERHSRLERSGWQLVFYC